MAKHLNRSEIKAIKHIILDLPPRLDTTLS